MLSKCFLIIILTSGVGGFYLPGLPPVTFCKPATENCKSEIPVFTNRLRSTETLLPYEYSRFDFCPTDGYSSLNLGQAVMGDRIQKIPYQLEFLEFKNCKVACEKTYEPVLQPNSNQSAVNNKLEFLKSRIKQNYMLNWRAGSKLRLSFCTPEFTPKIVDDVPVTWCYEIAGGDNYCLRDIPIGCYINNYDNNTTQGQCYLFAKRAKAETFIVFNHMDITVHYHDADGSEATGRIISVHVKPRSIDYGQADPTASVCGKSGLHNSNLVIPKRLEEKLKISYTYSVIWRQQNKIKWASRWDYILTNSYDKILWFSTLNSVICCVFLIGIFGKILWQTLRNNNSEEEMSWKLLHGDVFRPPKNKLLLCAVIGNGFQVFAMVTVTLALAVFGMLSPANRGALMTCILVTYACLGPVAGYTAARFYKMMSGEKKKTMTFVTALLFQGMMFGLLFFTNNIHWWKGSSAALPFTTILALLALWLCLSVPLTCLGAFCGFKRKILEQPVNTSEDHRRIPKKTCPEKIKHGVRLFFMNLVVFGVTFVNLFFILNSIWLHNVYYIYGFLCMHYLLLLLGLCMVSPLSCYFQLCAQDYHWWWSTIIVGGSIVIWVFGYMIYFLLMKTDIRDAVSVFLYVLYSIMMLVPLFLLSGSVAFISSFLFVKKMYSVIKQ